MTHWIERWRNTWVEALFLLLLLLFTLAFGLTEVDSIYGRF